MLDNLTLRVAADYFPERQVVEHLHSPLNVRRKYDGNVKVRLATRERPINRFTNMHVNMLTRVARRGGMPTGRRNRRGAHGGSSMTKPQASTGYRGHDVAAGALRGQVAVVTGSTQG